MRPLPPVRCKSCIFREDGNALPLMPGRLEEIKAYLLKGSPHRCLTDDAKHCRGGRDFQLFMWARMGIIAAPTDEALAEAMRAEENRNAG